MARPSKVALVTGASRGIGRAIALALVRQGCVVGGFGRDEAALAATEQLVRSEGGQFGSFVGNAESNASIAAYAQWAVDRWGGIDVVINNAGIVLEARPEETTPEQFSRIMQVNLFSQFALARAAYPSMKSRGGGAIVNIGSLAGAIAFPRTVAYCASKAAIEGMTRALAYDWASDNIRVVCIAPGYVKSDFVKDAVANPKIRDWIVRRIPLGRMGTPAEIGEFAAFLTSDAAGFCTGETFYVDGGQRMAI